MSGDAGKSFGIAFGGASGVILAVFAVMMIGIAVICGGCIGCTAFLSVIGAQVEREAGPQEREAKYPDVLKHE